jgi:hypothetical protein
MKADEGAVACLGDLPRRKSVETRDIRRQLAPVLDILTGNRLHFLQQGRPEEFRQWHRGFAGTIGRPAHRREFIMR